jgi:hypothetical protein
MKYWLEEKDKTALRDSLKIIREEILLEEAPPFEISECEEHLIHPCLSSLEKMDCQSHFVLEDLQVVWKLWFLFELGWRKQMKRVKSFFLGIFEEF